MEKNSKFEQCFYQFSMQFLNSNENEINELNNNEIDEFVKQSAQNIILFRFFIQNIENENDDFFDNQIVHFKTSIRKSNRNSDDDKIKTFKKNSFRIFFRKTKKTSIFVSNSHVKNVFCEKNIFV